MGQQIGHGDELAGDEIRKGLLRLAQNRSGKYPSQ